jgi:hypothetical protein
MVLSAVLLRYDIELKSNQLKTIERFQHEPVEMVCKIKRKMTK